jgi:hypothetical protein
VGCILTTSAPAQVIVGQIAADCKPDGSVRQTTNADIGADTGADIPTWLSNQSMRVY